MNNKDLDKFYTNPNVAEELVTKVNKMFNLSCFDHIVEPSAGSGNFLKFLPSETIALDIKPEGEGIIKEDFFNYYPPSGFMSGESKVLTIGNPPFGSGYMNPLAKKFFNHAATFSEVIAFIVPAKWHTAWKIHYQLDERFGLYYSKLLPSNSFTLNNEPHNVNCCAQIWSKSKPKYYTDKRIYQRPPTAHPDFEMFLTCDNVPRLPEVRKQLRNREYWDFAIKYWGKIHVCEIDEVDPETTTHYLIKTDKKYVREIFENVVWSDYVNNMGAPNMGGKSLLVRAYKDTKIRLGY